MVRISDRLNDQYTITSEPFTLMVGIIGIIFGLFYILQKLYTKLFTFYVPDLVYTYFFAGYTLVAGIILVFKASRRRINRPNQN